jgi:hypothetical protein
VDPLHDVGRRSPGRQRRRALIRHGSLPEGSLFYMRLDRCRECLRSGVGCCRWYRPQQSLWVRCGELQQCVEGWRSCHTKEGGCGEAIVAEVPGRLPMSSTIAPIARFGFPVHARSAQNLHLYTDSLCVRVLHPYRWSSRLCAFWLEPVSAIGSSAVTMPAVVHFRWTYHSAWLLPPP